MTGNGSETETGLPHFYILASDCVTNMVGAASMTKNVSGSSLRIAVELGDLSEDRTDDVVPCTQQVRRFAWINFPVRHLP